MRRHFIHIKILLIFANRIIFDQMAITNGKLLLYLQEA